MIGDFNLHKFYNISKIISFNDKEAFI